MEFEWILDNGTYYLKEGSKIISGIKDGAGIGVVYSKGEDMWTVFKHGDPETLIPYCQNQNIKLKDAIEEFPDMKCFFVEIRPVGDLLDLFNHTLQCTGRIKKYLLTEYTETIDMI